MKKFAATALAGLALLLAGACGTGSSAGTASTVTAASPPLGRNPAEDSAAGAQAASLPAPGKPAVAGQPPGPGQPATGLPGPAPIPDAEGSKIIRSAQMTVEVGSGKFTDSLTRVEQLIHGEGGYISGSTTPPQPDGLKTGTFSFQVPAARFDDAVAQLRALGTVQAYTLGGQDVSFQYVDLQARLTNAMAQRDAMAALLARATTIQDIINVQNQLGQITAQIEQLKGQINYFDHATSYFTISLTLREAGAVAKAKPVDEWGTRTALSDAIHNFLTTINYAIVLLGAVGPFLLAGLIGLMIWWWRPRRRLPVAAL